MNLLEKINAEQNKRNCFTNVSADDLRDIQAAIDAMVYFGWKESRAEKITIGKYLNGQYFKAESLVYCHNLHK